MENWKIEYLKEMITRNQIETHCLDTCNIVPFMIMGSNGKPFSATGRSRGRYVHSQFFTIHSICETRNCAVLEFLAMSKYGENMLFRTEARILVDLTCLCGFQVVPIPVYESLCIKSNVHDCFCRAFHFTQDCYTNTIWTNHQKIVNNTGEVYVHLKGKEDGGQILLQTTEGMTALSISNNDCRTIPVTNLKSISISQPIQQIKGVVEADLIFSNIREVFY